MTEHIWLWVLLAYFAVKMCPITGIHWGRADSDHPGWWWIREETVYVRRIGRTK